VSNDGRPPVRLEAAAWKGKPVWLRTVAPWERPERDSPVLPLGYIGFASFVLIVAATMLAFGALARHNLRVGRSDTRGALYVAVMVFACFELEHALTYRWTLEPLQIWRWMTHQPFLP